MQSYTEAEILANPALLGQINTCMYSRQFSLEFLAATAEWYDSWICLRSQPHLTPAFCFRYLYDNGTDSADDWTDFNDIARYFARKQPHVSKEELEQAFELELERRSRAAAQPEHKS